MPRTTPATFMQPQQPDAVLGAIVGTEPLPRTEITKKIWTHIKANGAQDATNRRQINATTPELRALFGVHSWVTMFDLPRIAAQHYTPAEG
jgi:chromatin remodeling complex protein RSC6